MPNPKDARLLIRVAMKEIGDEALKEEIKATLAIEGIHVSDEIIDKVFEDADRL